jgi:hypothetical protein
MTCKKPCKLCPCKPTTPVLHRNLIRQVYDLITNSGGFPCHDKHPTAHAIHDDALIEDGKFLTTDCVGYQIWGLTREETIKKKRPPRKGSMAYWVSLTTDEKRQLLESYDGLYAQRQEEINLRRTHERNYHE